MNTNKQEKPINTCPCCGDVRGLSLITASDGREWFNAACAPCGMAMDEKDQWAFYLGGVKKAVA